MTDPNEGETMKTTWHVTEVHATEGSTIATLARVEWFKVNPTYKELMADDDYDGDLPDEFLEAEPGDETAEYIDTGDVMKINVTDGLDLQPGLDVFMVLDLATVYV